MAGRLFAIEFARSESQVSKGPCRNQHGKMDEEQICFPKKAIDLENQKTGWWHAYGACPGEEQPMNISRMQVTHINNPLGFDLGERPTFSWVVEGAAGARAEGLGQNRKMTEEEL